MSSIPCSIIVCQGALIGDASHPWSFVPVFVFNSQFNDGQPADEDLILDDGNTHPLPGQGQQQQQPQGAFDSMQDLNDVQQANIDEGWKLPDPIPNVVVAANLNANQDA